MGQEGCLVPLRPEHEAADASRMIKGGGGLMWQRSYEGTWSLVGSLGFGVRKGWGLRSAVRRTSPMGLKENGRRLTKCQSLMPQTCKVGEKWLVANCVHSSCGVLPKNWHLTLVVGSAVVLGSKCPF